MLESAPSIGLDRTVTSADGVHLAVRETGPRGAPTVVLVHGFPDDRSVWDGVAAELGRHLHVVTYDTRGAGASSKPDARKAYRLERLAADLVAVLDATSPVRPAHVVGHDWGAIQAWEAVTDDLCEPRIASFTAIAGPCLDHVGHWMRRVPRGLGGQALRSWYVAMFQLPGAAELIWRGGLAKAWPHMLKRAERVRGEVATPSEDAVVHGLELYRANILQRLFAPRDRSTRIPVQVVAPAGDRYVSPAVTRSAEPWVTRLFHRDVAGGHWIVRKEPARVARWIDEMVAHVEGRRDAPSLLRSRPRRAGDRKHEGRLVVVTGGASGIGRATALAFAAEGASLVLADVDRAGAEETARLAAEHGGSSVVKVVDVSDAVAMERFAAEVEAELGAPDVVVNNAGIGVAGKVLDTPVREWERVLGVNLWGVIHGSRLFGAQMVARGQGGHIVNLACQVDADDSRRRLGARSGRTRPEGPRELTNIASAAAFAPSVTLPAYATSKVAVRMFSECLRAELAPEGIGVSAICPGLIDTPITTRTTFMGVSAEEQERRRNASAKLYKRRGFGPERVATAILRAVERNEAVVPVSIEAHAFDRVGRYAPSLARALAGIDLAP